MNSDYFKLNQSLIRFPGIKLQTRDAHKLRGYFGELFKEHSPLLHNHYNDGRLRYRYPLVQYKVVDHQPLLTGVGEGAALLVELFLKIKELHIHGEIYPILSKNIENRIIRISDTNELFSYTFKTLWMALNEKNHTLYMKSSGKEKEKLLKKILIGNVLSFYKGIGFTARREILLTLHANEKITKFKNIDMIAFSASFVCNAVLPEYIGLGKAVSRGFGTIIQNK